MLCHVACQNNARCLDEKLDVCKKRPRLGKALRSCATTTLGLILFIFVPSILFAVIEGWSYGTSLYYSVVSLSTVGFGDYVAGRCSTMTPQVVLAKSLYKSASPSWTSCPSHQNPGMFATQSTPPDLLRIVEELPHHKGVY